MNHLSSRKGGAERIAFLDYLRIFAFASVVIGHKFVGHIHQLILDPAFHASPKLLLEYIVPLYQGGGAGVLVFFLVSGYIITHVLRQERLGEFAIKRFFRIYPLYWLAVFAEIWVSGSWPGTTVVCQRLLLIGDFFGTPYGLAGVEWTLRVEVAFYVFMVLLTAAGLLHQRKKYLPPTLILSILLLGQLPPVPTAAGLFIGYLTIYGPFLFAGVVFYLLEHKELSLRWFLSVIAVVFLQYFHLIPKYQPAWIGSHFAVAGFAIFTICWLARNYLKSSPEVRVLSDLTFAVYLFHNWLWASLQHVIERIGATGLRAEVQVLGLLLLICFVLNRTVERSSIALGRYLIRKLRQVRLASEVPTPKVAFVSQGTPEVVTEILK